MHVVLAINPFVLLSVVFGMAAFKGWFRSYSAATVLVLLVSAIFSLSYITAVAANKPTSGMGLAERVSQYGHQLWQSLHDEEHRTDHPAEAQDQGQNDHRSSVTAPLLCVIFQVAVE